MQWVCCERHRSSVATVKNGNQRQFVVLHGFYFWVVGELDDGMLEIKRARELAPISPIINLDLSTVLYYQSNYGEAINAYRKAQEIDPNILAPTFLPGQIYERNGEYGRAVEECQGGLSAFARDAGVLSALGYVYGVSGNRRQAQEIINELETMWKRIIFRRLSSHSLMQESETKTRPSSG